MDDGVDRSVHADPEFVAAIRRIASDEGLSGVIRVDIGSETVVAESIGWAHRALGVEMTVDAQCAIASGTKGFTALTVMGLVEAGVLDLDAPVRAVLGDDLPLIDDRVTVAHLLEHRSGIGDYLDEDEGHDDRDGYDMPISVHRLVTTADYVPILDGHPQKFAPGDRFSYCNGGYVVLALICERITGRSFHELVEERVCAPAGMSDTAFLRSDELPGRAALGYLHREGLRTNVLHLPVRGNGDGGIYSTAADVSAFWNALTNGAIVSLDTYAEMVRPRSDGHDGLRYGRGFWLEPEFAAVSIHGFDVGVGFVSTHAAVSGTTVTVLSNATRGAWPCSQRVLDLVRRPRGD